MKNKIEKTKDFLYNYIDFVIIFVIIILVSGVIAWRLDVLFDDDTIVPSTTHQESNSESDVKADEMNSEEDTSDTQASEEDTQQEEESQTSDANDDNTTSDASDEGEETSSEDNTTTKSREELKTIRFNIPAGSSPSKTADILLENGLITDKNAFLAKASEMGLDAKLQSGPFAIKETTALEDVIKIVSRTYK